MPTARSFMATYSMIPATSESVVCFATQHDSWHVHQVVLGVRVIVSSVWRNRVFVFYCCDLGAWRVINIYDIMVNGCLRLGPTGVFVVTIFFSKLAISDCVLESKDATELGRLPNSSW
jgi:hypothetical protein